MRKISPNDIRQDFSSQLVDLRSFYLAGMAGLTSDSNHSTLTEQSLLVAAVAWEGFISDLFIAYINVDATRFKIHLATSFDEHIKTQEKPNRVFQKFGKLKLPDHLSKADVHFLANSAGNNITFPNFEELEKRATTWLVDEHAKRIRSLTKPQRALINAVIALRNHVAHRSERSLAAMNDALAAGALHTTGIKRKKNKFHKVGAWLKAVPAGRSESRLLTILGNLEVIGAQC